MKNKYYTFLSPKEIYVDNPEQAKHSSGYRMHSLHLELRSSSTHYGVECVRCSCHPELRFACSGLSMYKSFGLLDLTSSLVNKK